MILVTNDLMLRPVSETYAAQMAEYYLRNKAFLAPYEAAHEDAFYTEEEQLLLLQQAEAAWQAGVGYRFCIFAKEEGNLIGTIALNNVVYGAFQSCFLGYKLDKDYCNRGYMAQAVQVVTGFAFNTLRLHRIEGNVMPRNAASLRVLQKCGFEEEGLAKEYLKINGVWEDHVHMVIRNSKV